jgi:hypothetical protein
MTTGVEGTHFFALDDGGVLFSEPAQRLYALNAAAAYCWLALGRSAGGAGSGGA